MNRKNIFHVGRPNVGNRAVLNERFSRVLDRNWLTNNGPMVQEFESSFATYCGVRNCVMVSNGTVGLELVVRALGLQGEVILPSFTFIATAHALSWHGIRPVFCDIDPTTLCIDPVKIASLVNANTAAILGVHLYGNPCAIHELEQIAESHRLPLIFDAAHAVACTYKGNIVGGFGVCEVFSFHATKVLNSVEGGAITTNDDELANRLRRMRNFGFPGDGSDVTVHCGTNAKMNELCAAMGQTNLEHIDDFIAANSINYKTYRDGLSDIPGLELLAFNPEEKHNYQYVVLRIHEDLFGHSREALSQSLRARGVLARRYFSPGCHAMEPYRTQSPEDSQRLPITESASRQVLALPTGIQIGASEIMDICNVIREYQSSA